MDIVAIQASSLIYVYEKHLFLFLIVFSRFVKSRFLIKFN